MIPRRDLLAAGVLGGLLGGGTTAGAQQQQQHSYEEELRAVAEAIERVRSELGAQRAFGEIEGIREAQKGFLRANSKLPDFIDVGIDVWFDAYDWLVRWQQPLVIGRDSVGRYTLVLLQTTVILRPELASRAIGLPYDSR